MTIKELIRSAQSRLQTDTNLLDIEILLSHVLQKNRTFLKTWPEYEVSFTLQQNFESLLARRIAGEPVAYIVGECYFWDFSVKVNSDVLVPRPETEHLVELALTVIPNEIKVDVADLGTGSGIIACALAKERANAHIYAVDKSLPALNLAQENAKQLKINNISFFHGEWFQPFLPQQKKFSYIVSNPPYIADNDPHLKQAELQLEPIEALIADEQGYKDLNRIISDSSKFLLSKGWLLLEHGYEQGEKVRALFKLCNFTKIETHKDLAGNDRITIGQFI